VGARAVVGDALEFGEDSAMTAARGGLRRREVSRLLAIAQAVANGGNVVNAIDVRANCW